MDSNEENGLAPYYIILQFNLYTLSIYNAFTIISIMKITFSTAFQKNKAPSGGQRVVEMVLVVDHTEV